MTGPWASVVTTTFILVPATLLSWFPFFFFFSAYLCCAGIHTAVFCDAEQIEKFLNSRSTLYYRLVLSCPLVLRASLAKLLHFYPRGQNILPARRVRAHTRRRQRGGFIHMYGHNNTIWFISFWLLGAFSGISGIFSEERGIWEMEWIGIELNGRSRDLGYIIDYLTN